MRKKKNNTLFHYDHELYEKLQRVTTPTVFALDLGLGKTQTLYQYLHDFTKKKVLIIVNNTRQLDEMKKALIDEIDIWHSGLDIEFETVQYNNRLGITKVKFFQLLLNNEYEFFQQYDEFYYDEFSGLSPIAATELVDDFAEIAKSIRGSGTNVRYMMRISDLFKQLILEIDNDFYKENIAYNVPIHQTLRGEAKDILEQYAIIRQDPERTKIILDATIIIILNSLIHDEIYMSRFRVHKKTKYALVVKTDALKKFIDNKHFIVFDATAELNRKDYEYLNINIDKNFSKNIFDYSDLTITNTQIPDVTVHQLRLGQEEAIDKLVQSISDKERTYYTFAPRKATEPLISTFGYTPEKLYYFFSGEDIGSNNLRDVTELVVIATQTYPKILRVVYNHVIYGYPLDKANLNEYDLAEWYMLTRDLVQLIGRTAIRKHNGEKVTVYLKQVENRYVTLMKEQYFKNCTIITNSITNNSRSKTDILIQLIKYRLISSDRDIVYIEDLINQHFSSKKSIYSFFTRNTDKITKIITPLNWQIMKKRGKSPYFIKTYGNSASHKEYRDAEKKEPEYKNPTDLQESLEGAYLIHDSSELYST